MCRPTVDRQSTDRFFGELFFTITLWSLYPLAGNLTSAGRLTFCRPARNVVCYIQKADAVSKILAGWSQAVFLTTFSHRFLFRPWFSFGVAESLTPQTRKEKNTQKIQLHMLNNHNQSLISFGWCYPLDKLSLSRGGSTPVSTVLRKSVRFFIINIFLIIIIIELSKLKCGKWSGQMFSFSNFWALDRNSRKRTLGT